MILLNLIRKLFLKWFCPHPIVVAPVNATWKMNAKTVIRVECVLCGKIMRTVGEELTYGKWKEKVCYHERI